MEQALIFLDGDRDIVTVGLTKKVFFIVSGGRNKKKTNFSASNKVFEVEDGTNRYCVQ